MNNMTDKIDYFVWDNVTGDIIKVFDQQEEAEEFISFQDEEFRYSIEARE